MYEAVILILIRKAYLGTGSMDASKVFFSFGVEWRMVLKWYSYFFNYFWLLFKNIRHDLLLSQNVGSTVIVKKKLDFEISMKFLNRITKKNVFWNRILLTFEYDNSKAQRFRQLKAWCSLYNQNYWFGYNFELNSFTPSL